MNKILENIKKRKSVRSFKNLKISHSDIETIVEAGLYAPSGMNRQTFQFTVIENREKIQNLAAVVRKALGRDESYNFYAPEVLIMLSDERDNSNGLADCACALENIFLMATELGIGSVWINQLKGICDEADVRPALDELGIPKDHVVWGMAALGYEEGNAQPKNRVGKVVYVK